MFVRVSLVGVAILGIATPVAMASGEADAMLRSLIGKDRATIERRIGPPDESQSNGVQTFLRYRAFDTSRIGGAPAPFGDAQGFGGELGFRGKASFECLTTLVLTGDMLRAYARRGSDCH
jgi:hypothetical protein